MVKRAYTHAQYQKDLSFIKDVQRGNFPSYLDGALPAARELLARYLPWIRGGQTLYASDSQIRAVFPKVYETAVKQVSKWEQRSVTPPAFPPLEQRLDSSNWSSRRPEHVEIFFGEDAEEDGLCGCMAYWRPNSRSQSNYS